MKIDVIYAFFNSAGQSCRPRGDGNPIRAPGCFSGAFKPEKVVKRYQEASQAARQGGDGQSKRINKFSALRSLKF